MSVSTNQRSETRSTRVRTLARFGSVLSVSALLFFSGCVPPTPCTSNAECDFCDGGTCTGGVCGGTDPCSAGQICDEDTNSCLDCEDDVDCDDGDACTVDTCASGSCSNDSSAADAACDDGDPCNGVETCDVATGDCVDGDDPCDAATEVCESDGSCTTRCTGDSDCDACLGETCGADDLCASGTPVVCDDGDACNGLETCLAGACVAGTAPDCDDGIACTDDACSGGSCSNTDNCTVSGETCNLTTGACAPTTAPACTIDSDCADLLFCNGAETCVSGTCTSGTNPCSAGQTCDEPSQTCTSGGQTFVLTDKVDAVNGLAGDDLIIGVVQTTLPTLSAGDQINGGAGIDRLNIIVVNADYAPIANISNVERFFVQNADTVTHDINMTGITGATDLWTDRSLAPLSFSNIGNNASVGLFGTSENLTAKYLDSVLDGTADTIQVDLSNSTATIGATVIVGSQTGAASGTDGGPETIMINCVGSANRIASIDDNGENDFVTLSFKGDQACRVDAIGGSVKTINGSAATGNLDINVANADANSLTITGGSGDDTVRSAAMTATDSFDGGAGNDTLDMTGAFSGTTLTAVEVLKVTHSDGTTVTVDLDKAQSINNLTITNNGSTLTTLALTKLPSNPTVTLSSNTDLTMSGASSMSLLAANSTGSSDSATLNLQGNGTLNFTGAITTSTSATEAIENITVNSTGGDVTFNVVNALDGAAVNKLAKVTLLGSADVALANSLGGSVLVEVDGSGMTGKLFMGAVANDGAAAITLKGGPGNDQLVGGTGADTLTGNSGNDTLTGGAGIDTITGGLGNDTITPGAGVDIIDGGADNDDFRFAEDGTVNSDTIANFQIDDAGANDAVALAAGAGFVATLDDGNGVDQGVAARGALTVTPMALNSALIDLTTGPTDVLKLTDTTQSTFTAAIGTGTGTVGATVDILVVFYDATNGVAVVGSVNAAGGAGALVLAGDDTFIEICRLDITAAEYANLDTDNFLIF